MVFLLIGSHLAMVVIARMIWKERQLQWSEFDTKSCFVLPIALLLLYILARSFVPQNWLVNVGAEGLGGFIFVTFPPLCAFWLWFFWSGRRRDGTNR